MSNPKYANGGVLSPIVQIDSKASRDDVVGVVQKAMADSVAKAYQTPTITEWVQGVTRAQAERTSKVSKLLTATLETSLQHLDDLRRSLERTHQKNIADVRNSAGYGADLLAAIEGNISYYDLVQLINEMRDGIAARRVAAKVPA